MLYVGFIPLKIWQCVPLNMWISLFYTFTPKYLVSTNKILSPVVGPG